MKDSYAVLAYHYSRGGYHHSRHDCLDDYRKTVSKRIF